MYSVTVSTGVSARIVFFALEVGLFKNIKSFCNVNILQFFKLENRIIIRKPALVFVLSFVSL